MLLPLCLFYSVYQWTPLHIAVRKGKERTVECIVGNKADINIKGSEGVSVWDLVYLLKVDYNVVQLIGVCQWVYLALFPATSLFLNNLF